MYKQGVFSKEGKTNRLLSVRLLNDTPFLSRWIMASYVNCKVCGAKCRGFVDGRCKKCHIKEYRHSKETRIKISNSLKG